jgi:hypothetical protein
MSFVNQHVQLYNLMPLLRFARIKGFMRGTTLFQWPWRCMVHIDGIWIISSRSVFVFFMIDDQEVIYPWFFTFIFLSNTLVLLFNMFEPLLWRGRLHWHAMLVLYLPLLLNFTICMEATLEGLWVK